MPGRDSLKFRTLVVIPPFYRSAALRGVPGGGPREVDINAQHRTRGALNTRNRRRWGDDERRKGGKIPGRDALKFRILVAIPPFYRSVGFPGGGRPRDFARPS